MLVAVSKHGRLKDPSLSFSKMPVVKVAQNSNGLSLGGIPRIVVRRTRALLPTLKVKLPLLLPLSHRDHLTACRMPAIKMAAKWQWIVPAVKMATR